MCGILALYDPRRRWNLPTFEKSLARLESRGPDGFGIWQDGEVCLGHRRLSIIDLEGGAQPMISASGRTAITYNGEIYNFESLREELIERGHAFATRSDTEVILAAWEEWEADAVDHIEGMFAFVIWDKARRRIFAARDRTGIKPLYYSVWEGGLIVASTLDPFFELPGFDCRVDPEAIRDVLVYDYVPAPRTMLKQVRKLVPGHVFQWSPGDRDVACSRYWEVPRCDRRPVDFQELTSRCRVALESAVERQMISDVPLGAFLSGGIDSSLIVAMMARVSSSPIRTFSVSFRDGSNEAPIARSVAERYGTEHVEFEAGSIDSETLLDTLMRLDEPLSDPAIVPTRLISAVARKHVTVVLSGEGGDEVFGGYPRFQHDESAHPNRPSGTQRALKRFVDALPIPVRGFGRHYESWLTPQEAIEFERARFGGSRLPGRDLAGVLTLPPESYHPERYLDDWREKMARYSDRYDTDTLMRVDLLTKLSENHLFKSDRASMMESLELRVPFLDELVLAEVLPHPASAKIVDGQLKAILIALCRDLVPREVWDRPKHGFNVPIGRFMAVEWKDAIEELLAWGRVHLPIFDYRRLRAASRLNQRTHQVARSLWSPLMVIAWFRAHPGASL